MENNRYQHGKIYKIVDVGYNKCYIGSTCEKLLSQRMARHRAFYFKMLRDGQLQMSSSRLFQEYGVDNCKIELIENFPCSSKEELLKREGFHIQSSDCVNKNVAGRSHKQWEIDNQEKIKERKKKYAKNNKDELTQRRKSKREEHIDEARKREVENYYKYKDRILKKLNTKVECPCGEIVNKSSLRRHEGRQKHQRYILENNI